MTRRSTPNDVAVQVLDILDAFPYSARTLMGKRAAAWDISGLRLDTFGGRLVGFVTRPRRLNGRWLAVYRERTRGLAPQDMEFETKEAAREQVERWAKDRGMRILP